MNKDPEDAVRISHTLNYSDCECSQSSKFKFMPYTSSDEREVLESGATVHSGTWNVQQIDLEDAQRNEEDAQHSENFSEANKSYTEDGNFEATWRATQLLLALPFFLVGAGLLSLFVAFFLQAGSPSTSTPFAPMLPLSNVHHACLPKQPELNGSAGYMHKYLPKVSEVTSLARVRDFTIKLRVCPASASKTKNVGVTSLAIVYDFRLNVCENVITAGATHSLPALQPAFSLRPLEIRPHYPPQYIALTALALVVSPYEPITWTPRAARRRARISWGDHPSCPTTDGHADICAVLDVNMKATILLPVIPSGSNVTSITGFDAYVGSPWDISFHELLGETVSAVTTLAKKCIAASAETVLYTNDEAHSNPSSSNVTNDTRFDNDTIEKIGEPLPQSLWEIDFYELPALLSTFSAVATLVKNWIVLGLLITFCGNFWLKFGAEGQDQHKTQRDEDDSCQPSLEFDFSETLSSNYEVEESTIFASSDHDSSENQHITGGKRCNYKHIESTVIQGMEAICSGEEEPSSIDQEESSSSSDMPVPPTDSDCAQMSGTFLTSSSSHNKQNPSLSEKNRELFLGESADTSQQSCSEIPSNEPFQDELSETTGMENTPKRLGNEVPSDQSSNGKLPGTVDAKSSPLKCNEIPSSQGERPNTEDKKKSSPLQCNESPSSQGERPNTEDKKKRSSLHYSNDTRRDQPYPNGEFPDTTDEQNVLNQSGDSPKNLTCQKEFTLTPVMGNHAANSQNTINSPGGSAASNGPREINFEEPILETEKYPGPVEDQQKLRLGESTNLKEHQNPKDTVTEHGLKDTEQQMVEQQMVENSRTQKSGESAVQQDAGDDQQTPPKVHTELQGEVEGIYQHELRSDIRVDTGQHSPRKELRQEMSGEGPRKGSRGNRGGGGDPRQRMPEGDHNRLHMATDQNIPKSLKYEQGEEQGGDKRQHTPEDTGQHLPREGAMMQNPQGGNKRQRPEGQGGQQTLEDTGQQKSEHTEQMLRERTRQQKHEQRRGKDIGQRGSDEHTEQEGQRKDTPQQTLVDHAKQQKQREPVGQQMEEHNKQLKIREDTKHSMPRKWTGRVLPGKRSRPKGQGKQTLAKNTEQPIPEKYTWQQRPREYVKQPRPSEQQKQDEDRGGEQSLKDAGQCTAENTLKQRPEKHGGQQRPRVSQKTSGGHTARLAEERYATQEGTSEHQVPETKTVKPRPRQHAELPEPPVDTGQHGPGEETRKLGPHNTEELVAKSSRKQKGPEDSGQHNPGEDRGQQRPIVDTGQPRPSEQQRQDEDRGGEQSLKDAGQCTADNTMKQRPEKHGGQQRPGVSDYARRLMAGQDTQHQAPEEPNILEKIHDTYSRAQSSEGTKHTAKQMISGGHAARLAEEKHVREQQLRKCSGLQGTSEQQVPGTQTMQPRPKQNAELPKPPVDTGQHGAGEENRELYPKNIGELVEESSRQQKGSEDSGQHDPEEDSGQQRSSVDTGQPRPSEQQRWDEDRGWEQSLKDGTAENTMKQRPEKHGGQQRPGASDHARQSMAGQDTQHQALEEPNGWQGPGKDSRQQRPKQEETSGWQNMGKDSGEQGQGKDSGRPGIDSGQQRPDEASGWQGPGEDDGHQREDGGQQCPGEDTGGHTRQWKLGDAEKEGQGVEHRGDTRSERVPMKQMSGGSGSKSDSEKQLQREYNQHHIPGVHQRPEENDKQLMPVSGLEEDTSQTSLNLKEYGAEVSHYQQPEYYSPKIPEGDTKQHTTAGGGHQLRREYTHHQTPGDHAWQQRREEDDKQQTPDVFVQSTGEKSLQVNMTELAKGENSELQKIRNRACTEQSEVTEHVTQGRGTVRGGTEPEQGDAEQLLKGGLVQEKKEYSQKCEPGDLKKNGNRLLSPHVKQQYAVKPLTSQKTSSGSQGSEMKGYSHPSEATSLSPHLHVSKTEPGALHNDGGRLKQPKIADSPKQPCAAASQGLPVKTAAQPDALVLSAPADNNATLPASTIADVCVATEDKHSVDLEVDFVSGIEPHPCLFTNKAAKDELVIASNLGLDACFVVPLLDGYGLHCEAPPPLSPSIPLLCEGEAAPRTPLVRPFKSLMEPTSPELCDYLLPVPQPAYLPPPPSTLDHSPPCLPSLYRRFVECKSVEEYEDDDQEGFYVTPQKESNP